MNDNDLKAFTARITQANPSELVVIVYEIIMKDIENAKEDFANSDMVLFARNLNHAVKFVNELIDTLDSQYPITYDLMKLYLFCNKQIIKAVTTKDVEPLTSAINVLNHLLEGFKEVAKQDTRSAVMSNTQQVYAGLTYGKGQLNETYIDPSMSSRGFKA